MTITPPLNATYGTHPHRTQGRLVREEECAMRSVFQRDRDRIIHCAAFRRLEYKTQVFINHEGDHYRTRLTHSLEVAQLARSMCRALGLNEDLGEAIALAHDLGHTPFGHAGEDGLQEAMSDYGGFDHNGQALRILTSLEQRYAEFDGLNLSWETLEGLAKHNGPLITPQAHPLPEAIAEYNQRHDLDLHSYAGAEAQVAAIADDIAYNNHDLEDGIRAEHFTLNELRFIPLMEEVIAQVDSTYAHLAEQRRVHEVIRRVINRMVADVLNQTQQNVEMYHVRVVEDVRALNQPLVHFSSAMDQTNRLLKSFLMERMYRHYRVNRMSSKAKRVLRELFAFFFAEPECLPHEWRDRVKHASSPASRARIVCDFIAGMTDRFALNEHTRIFNVWERT
jgi:dGTPase